MDIRCTQCGEPWDMDSLHDVIAEEYDEAQWKTGGRHDQKKYEKFYSEVRQRFSVEGCRMFGTRHNETPNKGAAAASSVLFDLFGDDVDGIASGLEDAEMIGLFD